MNKNQGQLTLVPTSITEAGTLNEVLKETLKNAWKGGAGICVEDIKPGRRRWLKWGLPREAIEDLITYNEHSRDELDKKIVNELKQGKNFFLISDGGTPGFCDPGRSLVIFGVSQIKTIVMQTIRTEVLNNIPLIHSNEPSAASV